MSEAIVRVWMREGSYLVGADGQQDRHNSQTNL